MEFAFSTLFLTFNSRTLAWLGHRANSGPKELTELGISRFRLAAIATVRLRSSADKDWRLEDWRLEDRRLTAFTQPPERWKSKRLRLWLWLLSLERISLALPLLLFLFFLLLFLGSNLGVFTFTHGGWCFWWPGLLQRNTCKWVFNKPRP